DGAALRARGDRRGGRAGPDRRRARPVPRAARRGRRRVLAARRRRARRRVRSRSPPPPRARDPRACARKGNAVTNENRLDEALRHQLRHTLDATPWTSIGGRPLPRYDGKVRDCYIDKQRGERIIVVTDRLSAFDAVVGTIPSKGQVLNQLATFW